MSKTSPPWTPQQVDALNSWQDLNFVHPFTCGGNRHDAAHTEYVKKHGGDNGQLVATNEGLVCPVCNYKQDWAHGFMVDCAIKETEEAN